MFISTKIRDKTTGNAVIIPTNLGAGAFDYACMMITTAVYASITIHAWIPHVNSGAQYVIISLATGAHITALNHTFDQAFTIYQE